jgi:hypothetical protein
MVGINREGVLLLRRPNMTTRYTMVLLRARPMCVSRTVHVS